jgi:DNA-directed RNA polymerase subunit E"
MKACRNCSFLVEEKKLGESESSSGCPRCGGTLTSDWQGFVIIIDHTRSQIAKKMNITFNGWYALKVREARALVRVCLRILGCRRRFVPSSRNR